MMFSTAPRRRNDSHSDENNGSPSVPPISPQNSAQTSAAVARETSLDAMSPRASEMRHRHRLVPTPSHDEAPPFPVLDDADVAAGHFSPRTKRRINKLGGVVSGSETDFLLLSSRASAIASDDEDDIDHDHLSDPETETEERDNAEKYLVLGVDISHMSRRSQFLICASGVFFFSLLYGFLQELLSVQIFSRQLGMFLATAQFSGYTAYSYLLRTYVQRNHGPSASQIPLSSPSKSKMGGPFDSFQTKTVPMTVYIGLSLLRAVDLSMTNLAMKYINYPAKTLMKSSRVIWTMMFGVVVLRKRYRMQDYAIVLLMVAGLGIFMHADANSSAVFDIIGIVMLTTSLICDGAVSNMSEAIMNQFDVGQDEFIFRLYSIALVAIFAGALLNGDLLLGMKHLSMPGTYDEIQNGLEPTWSIPGKIFILFLFSTMGFFGSSCSAAITKNFGALTMSITSTARKATTLFLSFAFFPNTCTLEHIVGILLFLLALVGKSLKASKGGHHHKRAHKDPLKNSMVQMVEIDDSNRDNRNWNRGDNIV